MAATNYEVYARLTLRGMGQAATGLGRLSGSLQRLGARIRGTQSMFGGLLRNVMGIAAAYVGFRAIGGLFRNLVSGAISLNAQLETTRIGLQSVIASVQEIPFEAAAGAASQVYQQLLDDALSSVASTQELFSIFQGIAGPILNAGFALQDVREITNQTAAAAAALGVDFGQAQRDIALMVSGAAGMDTKLFRMLRATGAIVESTQEWNRELAPEERVERLREALGRFESAATAYGQSWAGLTSSLNDLWQNFRASLAGPIIDRLKTTMSDVVDNLVENRQEIGQYLQAIGTVAAEELGKVLDRVQAVFQSVIQNWDTIVDRVSRVLRLVRTIAPPLIMTMLGIRLGRTLLGGGLSMLGAILAPISSILTMLASFAGGGGLLGMLGIGGGGAAAAGGGAAAAGGGAMAAAMAPLIMVALPLLAAVVATVVTGIGILISVMWVLIDNWSLVEGALDALTPAIDALWANFMQFLAALWAVLEPLMTLVGLLALQWMWYLMIGAMMLVNQWLQRVTRVLQIAAGAMATFTESVNSMVGGIFQGLSASARGLSVALAGPQAPATGEGIGTRIRQALEGIRERFSGMQEGMQNRRTGGAPVNDFSGSTINVNQDFREADPDRIAIQMVEDISRQAMSRVQSGFAPAFTR